MTDSSRQSGSSYQASLFLRLLAGIEKLNPAERKKTAEFIRSAGCADGGFRGRSTEVVTRSDLYYTGFALRSLLLLDSMDETSVLQPAKSYIDGHSESFSTPAELFSYTFCLSLLNQFGDVNGFVRRRTRLLECWSRYRRADGCYASSENTTYSSTYMTFLAAGAFELLDAGMELAAIDPEPLLHRQGPDGGFVELEPLKRSGTNPTAAAVALLKMRGVEPLNRSGVIDFLLTRQTSQGGFQANTQIDVADLLSSFTALVALADLEAEDRCDRETLRRFVKNLRSPDGGYRGAAWDRECDVEYTFYGLALESLLAQIEPRV